MYQEALFHQSRLWNRYAKEGGGVGRQGRKDFISWKNKLQIIIVKIIFPFYLTRWSWMYTCGLWTQCQIFIFPSSLQSNSYYVHLDMVWQENMSMLQLVQCDCSISRFPVFVGACQVGINSPHSHSTQARLSQNKCSCAMETCGSRQTGIPWWGCSFWIHCHTQKHLFCCYYTTLSTFLYTNVWNQMSLLEARKRRVTETLLFLTRSAKG